jgi:hypothetical protein
MSPRKKVLYLDVCALCRPFDDQSQMKIKLETDSIFLILEKIKAGKFKMLFSKIHNLEIKDIQEKEEREELLQFLEKYGNEVKVKMLALKPEDFIVREGIL